MDNETKNTIQEQFKLLPKVIQDTILNSNWQEKIRRVVKNNNLHIDQGAAIENLVLITMLGIETPEDFVERAKEYAEVTEEQAYTISNEVEREIFGDIRRKLIEIADTANTVDDIDRTADELNKVAAEIERQAHGEIKKAPLKDKIPPQSFSTPAPLPKPISAPIITPEPEPATVPNTPVEIPEEKIPAKEKIDTTFKEPTIAKSAPAPIFIPMPKSIEATPEQKIIPKSDPYREPIA